MSVNAIVRLAARGDGVDNLGGYHAGTAPGDVPDADGVWLAGPNRQAPACRHFGKCGGCQLQHVSDGAYAGFVIDRIADALKAQGLNLPEMREPYLSPPYTRRRTGLRAMKLGKRIVLGFAEARSHQLVDLTECPVLHPALFAMISPLRHLLAKTMRDKRPCDITMTLTDQGVDMAISGVSVEGLEAAEGLSSFAQENRLARLSIDEGFGAEARWEPAAVTVTFGGIQVGLPAGAFLQATADGEAALVSAVALALGEAQSVADLFAGLGTFALAHAGPVQAVEGARDAALALQRAANLAGRHVKVAHRDLFRRPLTSKELAGFEAVIIDPPRAGAKEQVAELTKSGVGRIASVSCNPATFARDAKMLVDGGYSLNWIQPVGQFRWSTHVELAASFSR